MYLGGKLEIEYFYKKVKLKESIQIKKRVSTGEGVEAPSPVKYMDAFAVKQR